MAKLILKMGAKRYLCLCFTRAQEPVRTATLTILQQDYHGIDVFQFAIKAHLTRAEESESKKLRGLVFLSTTSSAWQTLVHTGKPMCLKLILVLMFFLTASKELVFSFNCSKSISIFD